MKVTLTQLKSSYSCIVFPTRVTCEGLENYERFFRPYLSCNSLSDTFALAKII